MIRTRKGRYRPQRRGMILLVVLTLLTLFALVGISFVLVANSQETAARIAREAETQFKPNIDPEAALAFVLGQVLYDVNDDIHGARSALRGHSLARSMYGWWDGVNPGMDPNNLPPAPLNDRPFTGTGRLYADQNSGYLHPFFNNPGGGTYYPPACSSDSFILNFLYHAADGFVRDPERLGWRPNPGVRITDPLTAGEPANSRWSAGAANVPYTYPDHRNFFLAQIDPNDGMILVPSFHREYLFGRLDLPPDTPSGGVPQVDWNPNWRDAKAKYLTLRPTLAHHPDFPMPIDRFGDVKNLDGFPGGADSIWIDVGAPVMTAPQMRSTRTPAAPLRYKMLVAPLILELDSRVNLNVVGNWLGINQTDPNVREHRSNQGWGLWEINPRPVLNFASAGQQPQEWLNLFYGSEGSNLARIRGRHDNQPPNPAGTPDRRIKGRPLGPGGQGPRLWAQVDYDGLENTNTRPLSGRLGFPTPDVTNDPGGSWVAGLPIFPGQTYLNGGIENYDPAAPKEVHPATFNVARPTAPNRRFPIADMAQLLRFGGSGSDALASDLLRLLPNNLVKDGGALRRRNLITLLSADLDRPGVVPYVWKPDANDNEAGTPDPANPADAVTRLRLRFDLGNPRFFPPDPPAPAPPLQGIPSLVWEAAANPPASGNAPIPFPQLSQRNSTPPGEFDGRTWRSTLGDRGRLDLGRAALKPYPTLREIANAPPPPAPPAEDPIAKRFREATVSRQALALDIFETLRRATGAMPPNEAYNYGVGGGKSEEFNAIRYLAQLAVNIVDYIDTDDISTPFAIPGLQGPAANTEWVFGFELPRLVINEVYAQYDNDARSMNGGGTAVDATAGKYALNVWAELMNPLPEDRVTARDPADPFALDCIAQLYHEDPTDVTGAKDYSIYRLLLTDAKAAPFLRDPANAIGDPDFNKPAADPSRIRGVIGRPATPSNGTDPPYSNWTTARGSGTQNVRPLPAGNRFNDQGPVTDPPLAAREKLGFIVVGPKTRAAGGDEPGRFDWVAPLDDEPRFPTLTLNSPEMTWGGHDDASMMLAATFDNTPEADRPRPLVVLQRLANPRRPFNDVKQIVDPTDPAGARMIPNPHYNPYVTIDYHECHQGEVEYGRRFDTAGNMPTPPAKPREQRVSWGRNQPFAAFSSPLNPLPPGTPDLTNSPRKPQAPNPALAAPEPQHTFFRQNCVSSTAADFASQQLDPAGTPPAPWPALPNGTLRKPFDWLVHLDRAPISAGELLHVSALRPYDVLQYFVVRDEPPPGKNTQRHKAPWLDQRSRLHRFLEFVSAVNDPYRFDGANDPRDPSINPPPPALLPPYDQPPYNQDPYTETVNGQTRLSAPGYWGRPNSRVQGKINLNMVMSPEVLYSLADNPPDGSTAGNTFTKTDLDNIFNMMLVENNWPLPPPATRAAPTARTPKVDLGGSIGWRAMAGPTDRRLIGPQFSPLWTDPTYALNKPMWGLAMGYARNIQDNDPFLDGEDVPPPPTPGGVRTRGLPQTPLRSNSAGNALMLDNLDDANQNPPKSMLPFPNYQSKEILTKIFNHFTTRSNVFAIWLTVGFFEVTEEADSNGQPLIPVRLGAEVGKAQNRHVRYRMFSIVDRSQMVAFRASSTRGWFDGDRYQKAGDPTGSPNDQCPGIEIQLNWSRTDPQPANPGDPPVYSDAKRYFVRDSRTGREWEVTDNTILVYDPQGDNEEAVHVKSYVWVDPNNAANRDRRLYAHFMRAHGANAPVICHGNPGPMDRYDPRKDTDVVQYFQLID